MRVPSITVLRVLTALCLLPAVACEEPPPDNEIKASLLADADDKTVAVGQATTILLRSVKAGGGAGANDITATVAQVEGVDIGFVALAPSEPGAITGTTATATPEAGAATFAFRCVSVGSAVVSFETASGSDVVKTSAEISCFAAPSPRTVVINVSRCSILQADGASECTASAQVTGVDGPVEGIDITVSVKSATDRATGLASTATQILRRVDAPARLANLALTTGAGGSVDFVISAGTTAIDVVLRAEDDETNTVDVEVDIVEATNRSSVTLTALADSVGQGAVTGLDVVATNGNGTDAAGKTATITVTNGTIVAAGCMSAAGIATLDSTGKCSFEVTASPNVTEMTVAASFFAEGFADEKTALVTYDVSELGVMTLEVTKSIKISADGTGSEAIIAPRQGEIVIKAKKSVEGDPEGTADANTMTVFIPASSQGLIKFSSAAVGTDATPVTAGVTPTAVTLTNVPNGELHLFVVAENPGALGTAKVSVSVIDNEAFPDNNNNDDPPTEVTVNVDRALALRSLIFKQFEPTAVIGVLGSSLSSSTAVVFQLLDERNNPVGNKNISFEALTSAQGVTVIPTGATDTGGLVRTVVSAGSMAGPITVRATVVEKPELQTPSSPISVVGGLPNSALSSVLCDKKAAFDPFTTDCTAGLVDRFTNPVEAELNVQFRAEGGNITAFAEAGGGSADATFTFSEPGPGSADLLEWSYSSVRPTSPTSDLRTAFAGCFDATTRSSCDLVAICKSGNPRISAFCPLRPSKTSPDTATCVEDISDEALEALAEGGSPLTFADWEFDVFEARDPDARAQFEAYLRDSRACGYPVSCLTGAGGLGLIGDTADDCPVNLGCLDFNSATECPQDGLLDVLAAVRGEEAFNDENGNGVRDAAETFIDYPEPFLDKNSSCSFDDLNGLERLPENEQVRLSDLFIDGDEGTFGFGAPGSETESNGTYDLNTEITLKTSIVHLAGRPLLDFGEFVADAATCGSDGSNSVVCQSNETGAGSGVTCANNTACTTDPDGAGPLRAPGGICIKAQPGDANGTCGFASSTCTENARSALGGGALLRGCKPRAADFRDGETVSLAFRWKDANGNCPTADFAGTPTVTVEGPAKVLANDAAYSLGECGAAPGAINASNPERPWCEEHSAMGAPIRTFALEADCGADDVGTKTIKITFELDGTTAVETVVVGCPVCGDGVREGDEECDGGSGCDATCTLEDPATP